MRKIESWLNGLVKRETLVFIDRNLEHIELVETTTLLGFLNVKEETREVFLPNLKTIDPEKLRVIAEAYSELHETARRLKRFDNVR
jgi:hypothetical protein